MLADVILKVAGMEARESDDQHDWRPRASLAGPERCIRQQVYWATKHPKDKEMGDRVFHIFNDGFWHEELMIEWIEKSGFQIHSRQMEVVGWEGEPKILAHVDGVITDMLGVDRLLECKGMNHFTFQSWWEQKSYPLDYFTQCALGSRGIQVVNPDAREIVLLAKNKNTSGYIEYLMEYDRPADQLIVKRLTRHTGEFAEVGLVIEHICEDAAKKFAEVIRYRDMGGLPERPFEPGDFRCDYCSWGQTCWEGFVGEIDNLAEKVELDEELADTARYYKQLSAEITEQEKEKEDIRKQLIQILSAKGAKSGKVGEYVISLSRSKRASITWDDVPLLVQRQLDPYRKETPTETLRVNEKKPDKQKQSKKV
jgi:hypothetical protein